jgi:prepilin-type N-terminal cleavage/methylation domain-containing protein
MRLRRAFTLVELLIVIIVIAVLAAIAIPKFQNNLQRASETEMKQFLRMRRDAIERFHADTGLYPASLTDLRSQTVPATGLDKAGVSQPLDPASWKGPYRDNFTKSARHPYLADVSAIYSTTSPNVGSVRYNTSKLDSDGVNIGTW